MSQSLKILGQSLKEKKKYKSYIDLIRMKILSFKSNILCLLLIKIIICIQKKKKKSVMITIFTR